MEISRNLSKQSFSTGSGRVTLKNCLGDYSHLLKSPHFNCRFLDVMVLIRVFLLYMLNTIEAFVIFRNLQGVSESVK